MATNIVPSLETLPVELLHRIFDNLDAQTLLLSLQYVCRRLHSVTRSYNRFKLDFKSICKRKFHRFGECTDPQNVITLTLSDENQTCGQIGLFLSLYHIEDYNGLQSVTLISIEEPYLKTILLHLSMNCSLISLIIQCGSNSDFNAELIPLLSSIIGKHSFRKLDLTAGYEMFDNLEWPTECSIRNLRLSDFIEFPKFCTILRCSPHLDTITLRDCLLNDNEALNFMIAENISYHQLTSLTLEDCELEMGMIEALLSLTPSLIHLRIKGTSRDFFDGTRWERLFQKKLPNLNKFEFVFQHDMGVVCDVANFESVIAPFQTNFWLEIKHWFTNVVGVKHSSFMNLYSIPDCAPKISFHPKANKISRSTFPSVISDLVTMDSIRELELNLIEMQADVADKEEMSIHRLFNKLTKLILRMDGIWPSNSADLLWALIDLTTVRELELNIDFNQSDMLNTIVGIVALLEKMTSVRALIILNRRTTVETICSIVSNRVEHLQIPVNTIDEIKVILRRFDHLFSVTFRFVEESLVLIEEAIQWLTAEYRDFTYRSTHYSLSLWLGKKTKD